MIPINHKLTRDHGRLRNQQQQGPPAPDVRGRQSTATQRPRPPRPVFVNCNVQNADDPPDAHDPSKGVDHQSRRGSLEQPLPPAAAEVASSSEEPKQLQDGRLTDIEQKTSYDAEYEDIEEIEREPANLDDLVGLLETKLALGDESSKALLRQLKREPVLSSLDLAGVAHLIQSGRVKRIITMCGAGISVSAGIPDFRTPGTGLYSQLERFNLPEPEAVFSIGFFKKNPKPFHLLARELFPGTYKPTPTHYFIKLLHDKGLLLRCFTQNIDSLEHQAGLPQSAVVAAHGNFDSAHCIKCHKEHSLEHVKQAVFSDDICYCTKCGGLVKPDIVFFGEQLPDRFYDLMEYDFPTCDLLLVMGTSLVVQPFASLIDAVPDTCPRVLINRERVGEGMGSMGIMASLLGFGGGGGFTFSREEGAYRDVLYLGDTDDGVLELAKLLGWETELNALMAADDSSHHQEQQVAKKQTSSSDNSSSSSRDDTNADSSTGSRQSGTSSSSSGTAGKL